MINIKANSINADNIDIKVENNTKGGQAIVEAINIIIAATEILYNVYDEKYSKSDILENVTELLSFKWLEEENRDKKEVDKIIKNGEEN